MNLYLTFVFTAVYVSFVSAIDLSSCNITKTCLTNPTGCSVTDSKCLVFTYSWNSSQSIFNMELSGGSGNDKEYVGVAFSPDGSMQNSDLYYCTGTKLKSGVIQKRYDPPATNPSLPGSVTNVKASTANGVAMCSFSRTANVAKNVSGVMTNFNLLTTQYHVLQAFGNITNGTIHKHPGKGVGRFSSGPYNFTASSSTPNTLTSTAHPHEGTTAHSSNNITADCGKTKGCFSYPESCTPGSPDCMFCSWSYVANLNMFDIEIIAAKQGEYASIAFGTIDAMQDADMYYCTGVANQFFSGTILEKENHPTVASTLPSGLSNIHSQIVDGSVRCSFRRPAGISKVLSDGSSHDFNLVQGNYYLLFAVGPVAKNVL